jgi:signal transduction histidine kinase
LKPDRHGIRFSLLLVFILLSAGIVAVLGILQVGLIRPYYRNTKISSINAIADSLESELLSTSGGSESQISQAFQQTVENDVCVVIYNQDGRQVYSADLLGAGCVFNSNDSENGIDYHDAGTLMSLVSDTPQYSANLVNERTGQQMLVVGRSVKETLGNYYLFLNTPLEPVDSLISFFSRQYFLYTSIVIIIAVIFSFYLSGRIARPLTHMRDQAVKLSNADYSARFDGGSFTETQELASTLNKAATEMGRIDELRRDLMANVSHDIRTPITNIRAYAEMIKDISGNDPVKRNKHLDVIIKETDYMSKLVNEMSELSKMQSGTYTLTYENVDLDEKVKEIMELNAPLIANAGVIVETEIPGHLMIYADDLKIGEVIQNFLSNAIKHTPAGNHIWIRAKVLEDEETVHVEVQDEGEGISAEELPHIWDRYQKSSRSFSRSLSSTGLGLAIVKAILDAHHAKYGVTSKLHQGTTFWFELRETHEG